MADSNDDLKIIVGGDISPLEDALNQIPAAAQDAAAKIDAALGGVNATRTLQGDLDNVAQRLNNAGASAGNAAPPIETLGRSMSDTASSAQQAAEQADALSTAMQLAGAVIGAELLRDFASAALDAYSQMQGFEVSLTALAGGFQQGNAQIKEMISLANQDALSIPSVLTARTRMDALGLSSADANLALRLAADAAAAMNKSFDSTVSVIDRMVTSGAVMTRTLAGMGVSAERLAEVMNTTVSGISANFKALSESGRLEVLSEAMSNLAGIAQQKAATISGAFQRLQNDIFQSLAEVGKLITPTVLDWVDAFESLITAANSVMKAFESLHGTISPVGVSIDSAKNSTVEFIVSAGGLVTALGLAEAAVKALNLSWETLSTTMKAVPYIAVAAAGAELVNSINNWLTALDDVNQSEATLAKRLEGATQYLHAHGIEIEADRVNLKDWSTEVQAGFAELAKGGPTIEAQTATLARWDSQQKNLNDTLDKAKKHLADVQAAMANGANIPSVYASAVQEVDKAWKAADPIGFASSLDGLTEKFKEHNVTVKATATTLQQAQAAYDAAKASGNGLAQAQGVLVTAQNAYLNALRTVDPLMVSHAAVMAEVNTQYSQAQMRVAAATAALQQAQAAYQQAKASGEGLAQAQIALINAQDNYMKSLQGTDAAAKLHVQSLQDMSIAYDQHQMKLAAAKSVLDAAKESLDQIRAANGEVTISVIQGAAAFDKHVSSVQMAKTAVEQATSSLRVMTTAHADTAKALALLQQAQENYTAALKAAESMGKQHGDTLAELSAKYDTEKLAVEQATKTLQDAIAANDGTAKAVELVRMAKENLLSTEKQLYQGITETTVAVRHHSLSLADLGSKAQDTVSNLQIAQANLITARGAYDGSTAAVARLTLAEREYQSALSAATGGTAVHVQSIQDLTLHENALRDAVLQAKAVVDAARGSYDGTGTSLSVLNAAQEQFNKLLVEAGPAVRDLSGALGGLSSGYDGVATAAKGAAASISEFGRSSQNLNMDALQAMFGAFQGDIQVPGSWNSRPLIHPGPGVNAVIVNGEIVSEEQINPGTLGPGKSSGGSSSSVVQSVAAAVSGAVSSSLSTVADAAAVLKLIAQNDFMGAIRQLQKDGESLQNAFTDVMDAADAMRQAGQTVQDAGAQLIDLQDRAAVSIDTSTANIAASVGVMAQATNTIAQASQQMSGVVAVAMGVAAASLPSIASSGKSNYSTPLVASLNQYGQILGAPSQNYSSTVNGGQITISPTINAGTVVGQGGAQALAQTVMNLVIDGLRRAGMKF